MPKATRTSGNMFNAKNKKSQTPWLKNAMRSIGISSNEVLKDLSPNLHEVISSGAKTLTDVKKISRRGSTSSAINALSSNKFIKIGQDTIKNALEDIKTGNLNNPERQAQAIEKSMGLDSLDSDFGTFLDDSDWDLEDSDSPIVQQYISNGVGNDAIVASTVELSKEIRNQSENQLKVAKANIDTMISISSAQMLQSQEIGNTVISHLGNISNSLSAIVEYNNENMSRFIESSLAFMEKMGAKEEESSYDDKISPTSVYNNRNGGIKVSDYKKLVVQQFQKEFKGSQLGFVSELIASNPDIITSNPMGFVTKALISSMVPGVIKETMKGVEDAFSGFVPSLLGKIADLGDLTGDSIKNNLLRMFGKAFGVRADRVNGFDLTGAATKDAAVFDKMTRHSIVEIMPKYLRETSTYLKDILDLLGGNSTASLNRAQAFDYQQGRYRKVSDINDDVYGTIRDTVINKLDMSKYGSSLRKQGENLSNTQQQKYNELLDQFFLELEKDGKHLDVTDFSEGSKLTSILTKLTGDKQTKKVLEAALRVSAEDKVASLNANVAIQQAIAARGNIIKSMEEDPLGWNLYSAAADKLENIDEQIKMLGKTSSINPSSSDRRKGTPVGLLNDIFGILSRGINVKIVKGRPFGAYASSSPSETITETSKVDESNEFATIKDKDIETKTVDDIVQMMKDEGYFSSLSTGRDSKLSKQITSAGEHVQNAMHAIIFGNSSLAFNEVGAIVGDQIVSIGSKFKKEFLDPMKETVFGKKDVGGYSKDGFLSGMQNKFLDTYRSFKREFSGKGFIDSHGKKVEDKKEGEESVVSNIKGMMTTVKESMMDYIFGEKEKDKEGNRTGKRTKGHGALGFVVNSLREGFDGFSEFIFGEKKEHEEILESAKKKVSEVLPSGVTGSIIGGVTGLAAGGSLLGTLVGGPIGGALLGGTMGIVSKSDRFQDWLFGKKDEETQERISGFISKQFQDTFKENKNMIIGGAAVGFAKNAIFGSSGGLLGSLVGGPIAGALLGGTIGLVTKTQAFQEFLYGKDIEKADGTTKHIGGILNAFNGIFKKKEKGEGASGSKLFGMGVIGAGAGALGASVLGNVGLLGAMFTPFGPVGGALAGLAVSIKASKKGFGEYLFGTDDTDGNGNFIRHKNGVLQKFGNMLQVELFEPMKVGFENFAEDAQDFIIDKMLAPVEFAVAPFVDRLSSIAEGIKTKINGMIDASGKFLKDNLIDPIVKVTSDVIIKPMRRIFGGMFQAVWGVSKMILAAPFTGLSLLTNFNDSRNRKASRKRVMRENVEEKGFFGSLGDNLAIRFNMGNARKDAEYKYTSYAEEWDERKRQYAEDRKTRLADHKARREERARTARNRRMMGRWLGYDDIEDTTENRIRAQEEYDRYNREHRFSSLFKPSKLKFDGEPAGQSSSASGRRMSASDVLRESRSENLEVNGAILQDVHSIAQVITGGRSPLGNNGRQDNEIKKESSRNKKKSENTQAPNQEDIDDLETEDGISVGAFEEMFGNILNVKNKIKSSLNIKEGWKNSYARNKLVSIKDFFKNKKFPGFANGTEDAPEGFAVVGEHGPELVNLNGGESILPNERSIKVSIVDMTETAVRKFMTSILKISGKQRASIDSNEIKDIISLSDNPLALPDFSSDDNGDVILDALQSKSRNKESLEALEKARSAKTYDVNMKARKEEEKEEREKETLEVLKEQKKDSKQHFNLWSSIFSKKGLITGSLLLMSPWIIKFLKNFDLAGVLKSGFSDIINAFQRGSSERENGESAVERIQKNASDLGDAMTTGNWSDWVAPNGNLDHMSGAKANLITQHVAKPGAKLVASGGKILASIKNTGANFKTAFTNVFGKKAGQEIVKNHADDAGKALLNVVDDIPELAAKNKTGLMKKVTDALDTFLKSAVEYMRKKGYNVGNTAKNLIDDAIRVVGNHFPKISAKINAILGATAALGSTVVGLAAKEATWVTLGALNGVTGAARLFQVDSTYVTMLMRVISAALGGLASTTVGSIVDVVNELIVDVLGVDFIHEVAVMFYHAVAGEEGYEKLNLGQAEFTDTYNEYKNSEIEKQRATYNITHGTNYSEEEFNRLVTSGNINVTYKSFADFNDEKHQTAGSKIYNKAIKPIGTGVSKAWNGSKNFLFGSTEKYYVDANGFKYVENKNGSYDAYNLSGQKLGYISAKELPSSATLIENKKTGVLNRPTNIIEEPILGGSGGSDTFNGFPYYSQKDSRWGNISYDMRDNRKETIADSGCGPDAMAMIATKMSGRKVTPIEVARDAQLGGYRDSTGTNWGFVDPAAEKYGLSTSRVENPNKDYIRSELSKGRPVMLSGVGDGVSSPYTSQGHYVVATGMSGNDVMINDPRGIEKSGKYNLDQVAGNTGAAWSFTKKNTKGGYGVPQSIFGFRRLQTNLNTNTTNKNTITSNSATNTNDEETKLEKARELVVATMMSLKDKLHYTQDSGTREQVIQGVAGDCSSTCRWVYKHAIGIDPGSYTGAQISSSNGTDVDNTSGCPDEKNLLPGDLVFFRGRNGSVGHVEMYIGNGQLMGHGGPNWNNMGPTIKDMKTFCASRASSGKGYMKSRRFILPKNANKVTLNESIPNITGMDVTGASSTTSNNNESIFTKLGRFFTAFAEKAWTGVTTGVWDTDYSSVFNNGSSTSNSSSSFNTDEIANVNINAGEMEKSVYDFFTKNGFTPEATAGIMGNIYQESKFNPACIQGNGRGPAAGLFQWENYNTKSKRWAELNKYAKSQGKEWTDPKSQLEYSLLEMGQTQKWMWEPSNKNLTHVSSLEEFKQMKNPQDAAIAFSNHFERPGNPQNATRKAAAQEYYDKFRRINAFDTTFNGDESSSTIDDYFDRIGGGRGESNIFSVGERRYYNPSSYSKSSNENSNIIDFGKYTASQRVHRDSSNAYQNVIRMQGGRGTGNTTEIMLQKVVELLSAIATSSESSSGKLDMLKKLTAVGNSFTAVSNNQGGNVITVQKTGSASDMLLGATKSRNEMLANRIASGQ